jgi:predicted RNA-binding Zn ribbon-like protein
MKTTGNVRAYYGALGRVRMLGGDRTLDLANTVHWRDGRMVDFVPDYESLARWSVPALLLSDGEMDLLLVAAARHQTAARKIHGEWRELRGQFKSWLLDIAPRDGEPPCGAEEAEHRYHGLLTAVNAAIAGIEPRKLLDARLNSSVDDLLALPLRRSAAAIMMLIMFPPEGKVRQCQADRCGGFFIDHSRSKPRRWCSMDSCGNRAKAAEFRRRSRT